MTERLIFTNTKLVMSGKKGILRPNAEGYYEFPIGGFNCANSSKEVYTDANINEIFSSSSAFYRKVTSGKLFGEWGHPLPAPGEHPNAYMARASNVNDKDTCVFFKEIWNDRKVGHLFNHYKGIDKDSIITFGLLKPMGNKWETLQRAIDDPDCNIAFSVRNLSRDKVYRGVVYVAIEEIITYDAVSEQGVASSEKHASLKMESHRVEITPRLVDAMRNNLDKKLVRMEHVNGTLDLIRKAENFFAEQKINRPSYTNWN